MTVASAAGRSLEGPLADDDDLTPRERRRRKGGGPGADEAGGLDEVSPFDADDLLGPVDEFTLSLSEDVVRAAMASSSAAPSEVPSAREAAREAPRPPPPESVPASSFSKPADPRFARARPGSRSLPAPRPPAPGTTPGAPGAYAHDPLTTGVVPGGGHLATNELRDLRPASPGQISGKGDQGVGQYTSELMLDGLDEASAAPAPRGRPEQPRDARIPGPAAFADNPPSERLPEVPMPQPDTARARPLRGQSSAMRPRPAARPEPRYEPEPAPEPEPEPRRRGAGRRAGRDEEGGAGSSGGLEELLTLADEPPEREDTVSGTIDLLSSLGEAPPSEERSEPSAGRRTGRDASPALPEAFRRGAPPEADQSTLTGSLELLEEAPEPEPSPQEPPPAREPRSVARESRPSPPRPTSAAATRIRPTSPRAEGSRPEPTLPEPLPEADVELDDPRPPAGSRGSDDPLATRPIPRLDDPSPPAAPPPPKATRAAPAPAKSSRGAEGRNRGAEGRGKGPRPAAPEVVRPADEALNAFVNEKVYKEPILGWLATLIGTVILVGMIFFVIVVFLWLLAR
jgi:hypothetical protein